MGDGDRAEVRLGATGSDDVVRAAEDIETAYVRSARGIGEAFQGTGSKISSALGGAVRDVGRGIATLAQDSIRLATAFGNLSLAHAVDSARQLDDQLGRIVVSRGIQFTDLSAKLAGT